MTAATDWVFKEIANANARRSERGETFFTVSVFHADISYAAKTAKFNQWKVVAVWKDGEQMVSMLFESAV